MHFGENTLMFAPSTQFWTLIDKTISSDQNIQFNALKAELRLLSEAELDAFEDDYQRARALAYRWNLWGAATVLNEGCSDDGFVYFCDWLISRGQRVFEAALDDPDSLVDHVGRHQCEFPDFGIATFLVREEKTGSGFKSPESELEWPTEPAGVRWNEEELPQLYPLLTRKAKRRFWPPWLLLKAIIQQVRPRA